MSSSGSGYFPPSDESDRASSTATAVKPPLYPKAGDFVRYYDLDGGKEDGQVLVGKIRFIQKQMKAADSTANGSGWMLELTEMEDVGEGYYSDFGSRKRFMKGSTYRDLAAVSPVTASFVRSEDAYKVPTRVSDGSIIVKAEQYDIEGYMGPFGGENGESNIDTSVVEADGVIYEALKGKLLKYAAIAGAVGTILCDLTRGTEQAVIYFAGFLSSLLYLFFLALKTDTIGKEQSSFVKNVSNLRFGTPIMSLLGVALYNLSKGDANPTASDNIFSTVTPDQFAAVIVGFLTYRLPLIVIQIEDAFQDEDSTGTLMPGSAGMALQMLQDDASATDAVSPLSSNVATTTVFLVSGPQATGRSELVQQFLDSTSTSSDESLVPFTTPALVDKVQEGATFERFLQRNEFLSVDPTDRFGLTQQAIVDAGKNTNDGPSPIVVVDADVELAKKLAKIPALRLVGVWVGLGSVPEFEKRVGAMIDSGTLTIEEGETRESTIRSKIREIVKEIEFGISSGVFEFTILNDDAENTEKSLLQLKEAAKYASLE